MKKLLFVAIATLIGMQTAAAVTKDERALIVVSELKTFGDPKLAWLYQFLEASGVVMAQTMLGGKYKKIVVLSGSAATRTNLGTKITQLKNDSTIKAIDVFVHLHGSSGKLWFANGSTTSSSLKTYIASKGAQSKLRIFYSTACYGKSHAQDMVDAGFDAASGAVGVNANSSYEYPAIMGKLATGSTFKQAIDFGNNPAMRATHDNAAKLAGFPQANSFKVLRGNNSETLTSSGN